MCALSTIGMEGVEKAVNMSSISKNSTLKMVKMWWARALAQVPAARTAAWSITVLPQDPERVRTLWPDMWAAAYGDSGPAPCPTDAVTLDIIRGGTWLRLTEKRKQSTGAKERPVADAGLSSFENKAMEVMDRLGTAFQQFASQASGSAGSARIQFLPPTGAGGRQSMGAPGALEYAAPMSASQPPHPLALPAPPPETRLALPAPPAQPAPSDEEVEEAKRHPRSHIPGPGPGAGAPRASANGLRSCDHLYGQWSQIPSSGPGPGIWECG